MFQYSQGLIDRLIKYYKERNVDISPETASEYLDSMAGLYEVFTSFVKVEPKEKI